MRTFIALAALLVFAATAHAKEITAAEICGTQKCVDISKQGDMFGGQISNPPDKATPFLELNYTIGPMPKEDFEGEAFTLQYVPAAQRLRGSDGVWVDATPEMVRELAPIVQKLAAFPARKLEQVAPEVGVTPSTLPPDPPPAKPEPAAASEDGGVGPALPIAAGLALLVALAVAFTRRRRAVPQH